MNAATRTAVFLVLATAVGVAAVLPPLGRLADESFAWHMLQHLVLLYLVALLLIEARPFDLFARAASKEAVATFVGALRPLHYLALPPVALCIFVATLWATHLSPLYELALEHEWVHAVEHLIYVFAGVVFWLPVLAPPPLWPSSFPVRLFYLLVALPQGALLGMVIASARAPLYAHYASAAGSSGAALADQGAAAAVMWIAGGLVIFSAMLVTLAVWARREADSEPSDSRRYAS